MIKSSNLGHQPSSSNSPSNGAGLHAIERLQSYLSGKYEVRLNSVNKVYEVREKGKGHFRKLDKRFLNTVYLQSTVDGIKTTFSNFERVLKSHFTEEINPIREYLSSLHWNRLDHIGRLAQTVWVEESDKRVLEAWPVLLRRWLIGCVAGSLSSDYRNALCLVLVGKPGLGKSTWLDKLVPNGLAEYAYRGPLVPGLKSPQNRRLLSEKLLVNVREEMKDWNGKEWNGFQTMLECRRVSALGNQAVEDQNRIASFCTSTSAWDILGKAEQKRYLVFSVNGIKKDHEVSIEQVWAQAYFAYLNGESGGLSAGEMAIQKQLNASNTKESNEKQWLMKTYRLAEAGEGLSTQWLMKSEILAELRRLSGLELSMSRLSQALVEAGFGEPISKRCVRFANSSRYVYPVVKRGI